MTLNYTLANGHYIGRWTFSCKMDIRLDFEHYICKWTPSLKRMDIETLVCKGPFACPASALIIPGSRVLAHVKFVLRVKNRS